MKGAHGAVKDAGCYQAYAGGAGVTDVLELGVGRGADLFRLFKRARFMRCFVGVDVDPHALKEAKRRWKLAAATNDAKHAAPVVAAFVKSDLDSLYSANRLCDDYSHQFQLVSAQFCVHYFLDTLPEIVGSVLAPNGHFVCTLLDGKAVRASLQGRREQGFAREWRMDGVLQTSLRLVDKDGGAVEVARDATHVAVFVDTIGQEIVERLVDLEALITRMGGEGVVCVDRRAFTSFPSDFYLESDPMYTFSALYSLLAFQRRAVENAPWDD